MRNTLIVFLSPFSYGRVDTFIEYNNHHDPMVFSHLHAPIDSLLNLTLSCLLLMLQKPEGAA